MSSLLAAVAWHLSRRRIAISAPIGLTTAVGPELVCVDVQLECGEWLASLQTDKLAVAAAAA